MRLFTQISFLTTLLALFAAAAIATIAIALFDAPAYLLLLVLPVGCVTYFLALIIAAFISRPLRELALTTKAYLDGDSSVSFTPSRGLKEADELAENIEQLRNIYESRVDELVALQKRQDEFVSDIAHEFRTPLTAISGNAELMLDDDMPPATRQRFCEIILSEASRLKKLTNNLLTLQHAKQSGGSDNMERLNIEPIARDVVDILEPLASEKEVTITIMGAAPDILGNADELKQVLINLVDNALHHVEADGTGTITITLAGVNGNAVVGVKDNGCGFGDANPMLLFKRFYRTDYSRARNSGGSGLGLAIVKELVQHHDGEVSAFNAPEGGAVFMLTFPALG